MYNYFSPKYEPGKVDRADLVKQHVYYQFNRTRQMFEWDLGNDDIPHDILERYLQFGGQVAIAEHEGKLYAFQGGVGGEPSPYYLPTLFVVANPALDFSKEYNIGEDCVWGWNDSMYIGLLPMFQRYAEALADNEVTMRIASITMRAPYLISASDDKTRASAELFLKRLKDGELSIIGTNAFLSDEDLKIAQGAQSTGTNGLSACIEYEQYLKASWYNELGLSANYNMKREAINSSEAQMGEDALLPLCQDMLDCRKRLCDEVNALFGRTWSVDFADPWKQMAEALEEPDLDPDLNGGEEDGISTS